MAWERLKDKKAHLQIHAAVFLFAMPAIICKSAELTPGTIVVGRGLFAGLALWGALAFSSCATYSVSASLLRTTALLGVLYAVQLWSFFESVVLTGPAVAILCFCSYPLFTTVFEPLFFKTRVYLRHFVSIALMVVGLLIVTLEHGVGGVRLDGVLWGVLSGFLFAVVSLINKRALGRADAVVLGFYQNMFILLCSLPFFLLDSPVLNVTNVTQLLFMGVVCSALAHTLFVSSFKRVHVRAASVSLSLEPVYAALLAFVFLGELPTLGLIVASMLLILASVCGARD